MSKQWTDEKIKRYKKFAVTASVLVSSTLFLIKTFAVFTTGSLAILSSLVDSLSDIVASLVSFFAVRISSKPISCTHRYGYFKAEHLSALFQAAFIAGSGIFVFYGGIDRFLNPIVLKNTRVGIAVMIISLGLTICLVMFQNYVAENTRSIAVKADSGHYMVDLLSNGGIILSLVIVQFCKVYWFDTFTAFCIAVYLIFYAYRLAREAVDFLMDKELPEDIRQKVLHIITTIDGVKGVHDLRTRDLGNAYYFEVHIEMDGALSLSQAHDICDVAERKIREVYPQAQMLIHQDPYGIKEDRLDDALESCLF